MVGRLAGERGQECTAGGGMVAAPARAPLKLQLRTGKGGYVGRSWERDPATAAFLFICEKEGGGNSPLLIN